MDALDRNVFHRVRRVLISAAVSATMFALGTATAHAGTYKTTNFVVTAPNENIARQVGRTAEVWRKKLALEWLGQEMKPWYRPCTISVKVGQIGAGGATTFSFDRGHVFGWKMRVQGTLERILDSVIPHEVSHTVFACHFRRPLPRWADEGAATLVEHESEQRVQQLRLKQVLNTRQRIPLRKLLGMKDYPNDMQQVLVLYAEGYSLADYLVQQKGKQTYLKFLDDAYRNGWERAIKRHYGLPSVEKLETNWTGWITAGSPRLQLGEGEMLAANTTRPAAPRPARTRPQIIRSQSPNPETEVVAGSADSPIAPDPRRRRHATGSPNRDDKTASRLITLGRQRALQDGWVPVVRRQPSATKTESRERKPEF